MKRFFLPPLVLALLFLSLGAVRASTSVTGYLEGENLGLIHMDYSTGINPNLADPDYFIGNREDFYIDLDDPAFMGPGGLQNVTKISDVANPLDMCLNTEKICSWQNFAWSPRIGWVSFDGDKIQNTSGMGEVNFPTGHYPHINYDGFVNGFAWGETTGWMALSACAGRDNATCNALPSICAWNNPLNACEFVAEPATQNANEWGVYLDLTAQTDGQIASCPNRTEASCVSTDACTWNGNSCSFEGTPRGRFFEGFAWSQHLGWIGFENAATRWYNDGTKAEINLDINTGDHLWFPTQTPNGTLSWEGFAQDPETGIDSMNSQLKLTLNSSSDFNGCYNGPNDTGVLATLNSQDPSLDVFFPNVGVLPNAPHGFCKYILSGEIVNVAGLSYYIGDPDDVLPAEITQDPDQYRDSITIYTFAGDYDSANSILMADNSSKRADGAELGTLTFIPTDIARNPIVPIRVSQEVDTGGGSIVFEASEANWMRDVELSYDFENNTYFDTINPSQTPGNAPVILSHTDPINAGTTYSAGVSGLYPSGGQSTLLPTNNQYHLHAISFAPTLDTFVVDQIDLRVITAEIPPSTLFTPATPASDWSLTIDENSSLGTANPLPSSFNFNSPLLVTHAGLSDENLVIGKPVELSYALTNNSPHAIEHLGLDHEFNFYNVGGEGFGEEVLEIRSIEAIGALNNGRKGQTDLASGVTRFALLTPTPSGLNNSLNNTVFFSDATQHHNTIYPFESNLSGSPSPLNTEGNYVVEGSFYGLEDDVFINRADFHLGDAPHLNPGSTAEPRFTLTPVQIGGLGFSQDVEFELSSHYIAYRMSNAPPSFTEFSVYENANTLAGVKVQNIGLNTSGLVSGKQIYQSVGGRNLSVVSTAASAGLQREMHRNMASLKRNITPCSANTNLTSLSTLASSCVLVNELNKTVVAYYKGEPGDLLTLGAGLSTLLIPEEYSYTLIVEGGADVFIRDNLKYENANSSFGLIVLNDENGLGGDVYLDPFPTNIVGLLYAEGSLLSSPNGSTLYYGDTGEVQELKNQLYWQGKVASKNTLGGGPNLTLPPGITCPNTIETLECAQRYDLDYLRRFTVIHTPNGAYSLNNGTFSGGGTCNNALPECSTLGLLPTTISLNANDLIELPSSRSIDPVYLHPDIRRTPLGFSKEIDIMQNSVVR